MFKDGRSEPIELVINAYYRKVERLDEVGGTDGTARSTGVIVTFDKAIGAPPKDAFTLSGPGSPQITGISDGGDGDDKTWFLEISGDWPNGESGVSVRVADFDDFRFTNLSNPYVPVLYAPVREATPTASIDYVDETLEGLVPGATYRFSGSGLSSSVFTPTSDTFAIPAAWMGVLDFTLVATGTTNSVDSEAQDLPIPARLPASSVAGVAISSHQTSSGTGAEGTLSGITTAMDYLAPGTPVSPSVWASGTGADITGLAPGTYYVRLSAIQTSSTHAGAFCSEAAAFIIRDYNSLAFNPVFEGYSLGSAVTDTTVLPLLIEDSLNLTLPSTAQITVVSVDALPTNSAFVLTGTADMSTLSPRTGLAPGIYTETLSVSVTDAGGTNPATLAPRVTFTVHGLADISSLDATGSDDAATDALTITFAHPVTGLALSDFTLDSPAFIFDTARSFVFAELAGGLSYRIPVVPANKTEADEQKTTLTVTLPTTPGTGGMSDIYEHQKTTFNVPSITSGEATLRIPRSVDKSCTLAYSPPGADTSFIQLRLLKSPYYPTGTLDASDLRIIPKTGDATIDRIERVASSADIIWGGWSIYDIYLKDVRAGTVGIEFDTYAVQHTQELEYTLITAATSPVTSLRDYFLRASTAASPLAVLETVPILADTGAQGRISVIAPPGATKAPETELITSIDGASGRSIEQVILDGVVLDPALWSVRTDGPADYTHLTGTVTHLDAPLVLILKDGFTNTNAVHTLEVIGTPTSSYLYTELDITGIADSWGVALTEPGPYSFDSKYVGYSALSPLAVGITNTGNQATGSLNVTLTGPASAFFELSASSLPSLANGESIPAAFSVAPKTGLVRGIYTATVTVTGANGITAVFDVSFQVQNSAPYVKSGKEMQQGNASLASAYSSDVSEWFADADSDTLRYTITSSDATGAVEIDDATHTLRFVPDTADAGTTRIITVRAHDDSDSSATDVTVSVSVARPGDAQAPTFATHPLSRLDYKTTADTPVPLTFSLNADGNGTLSFQWYTNTTASAAGGTPIAGATGYTYTPDITEASERYYYVEVVATQPGAALSRASRVSDVATIKSANRQYTVTFDIGTAPGTTGAAPGDVSGDINEPITLPTSTDVPGFARTNHTFAGWSTAPAGAGTLYGPGSSYTSALDATTPLYAHWIENVALIFNSEGGSSVAGLHLNGEATYGDVPGWPISPASDPVRPGYSFVGWYIEEIDGMPVSPIQVTATSAITTSATRSIILHAHWLEDADVTIDFIATKGGAITPAGSVSVPPATGTVAARTAVVDAGYTFSGWTDKTGALVSTNPHFMPTKQAGVWVADTYTAHFQGKEIQVSFDANGGSAALPDTKTVIFGDTFGPLPVVVRATYTHTGWWTERTGGVEITALSTVADPTEVQVLYAHWTENIYPVIEHFGTYSGGGTIAAKIGYDYPSQFIRLILDATGELVTPSNYTVTQGSTVITLTEAYAQSFAPGTYYFTAEFTDGRSEPIVLIIPTVSSLPGTGDKTSLYAAGIAAILAASGLGLLGVAVIRRRRRG